MSDRYNDRIVFRKAEGETIKTTMDAEAYFERRGFYLSLGSDDTMSDGRKVKPNYGTWHLSTPIQGAQGDLSGEIPVTITGVDTYSNGGVSNRNLIKLAKLHQAGKVAL